MEKGLLIKIFDYYTNNLKFKEEMLNAIRIFFNRMDLGKGGKLEIKNKDDEAKFNEWFVFDFKMTNNKTPLEHFCEKNPYKLPMYRLQMYIDLLDNEYGFFEILEVKRGEGLELKNLRNENKYWIKEYSGTFDAEEGIILAGRIGKVGDCLELIGSDPYCFAKEFKNPQTGSLIADPNITPKKVKDFLESCSEIDENDLKDKILDEGNCICDICGKKGKIGGLGTTKEGKPSIICYNCNLKLLAKKNNISIKEAEKNRKKLFQTSSLFRELKFEDYFKLKNKKAFDSIEEANNVLRVITKKWNDLTIQQRKGFEKLNTIEQKKVYQKIKI